ncbi:response regulator transcription factor [Streptococcus gallolyticus]|uniref:response regulator transcription factor n=1 Tax=Streptococcus hepaticus TaxID=3349163 RepID=UPI001C946E03|nr:response regulator transcription factor [Streptococcus gallolyticus]MBY5041838.1 response regulator transcription factor [Streptococcus gallolyticus]
MHRILIAEDDKDIASLLQLYLEGSSFEVILAGNGEEAYHVFKEGNIDLAIVDIMMPKVDGYALTRMMRQESTIPIIILSAKSEDADKILGLNIGADDYISKPFNSLEVVARVQAQLRRSYTLNTPQEVDLTQLVVGELILDTKGATLTKNGELIKLTATEFKLLQTLMSAPGTIFTKIELYEMINGEYIEGDDSTIIVHISNLRDKIEDDSKNPLYIKTLRGIGYKIEKDH